MSEEKSTLILEKMWAAGLPARKTRFQGDVNNIDQVPESEFNESSKAPSRRVEMRLVPQGLLCLQKEQYFLVPLPHIKQIYFK